jgi:hypothetical protein
MNLPLMTVTGRSIPVAVSPHHTIGQVKQIIEDQYHLPVANVRLVASGHILADDKHVSELPLGPDFSILLHYSTEYIDRCLPPPRRPIRPSSPRPSMSEDPTDFKSKLDQLLSLGFAHDDAERSLRSHSFDVDRAASSLLDGDNPAPPVRPAPRSPSAPPPEISLKQEVSVLFEQMSEADQETVLHFTGAQFEFGMVVQACQLCGGDREKMEEFLLNWFE